MPKIWWVESCSRSPRAMLAPTKPQTPEMRIFMRGWSFAPRFYRRNRREVSRNFIGREGLHIHFHQAHERATVIRALAAAAIDDHADTGDAAAVGPYNVDRFLDA